MDHGTEAHPGPPSTRDLTVLLSKALRLLGEAGRPVAASKLAGKAWWAATKVGDEAGAARINGVMHYLARLPPEIEEEPPSARTQPAENEPAASQPLQARSTNG